MARLLLAAWLFFALTACGPNPPDEQERAHSMAEILENGNYIEMEGYVDRWLEAGQDE